MEKTSLALDITRKVAVEDEKTVTFYSLEMSKEQLIDRMLLAEAEVNILEIRTEKI